MHLTFIYISYSCRNAEQKSQANTLRYSYQSMKEVKFTNLNTYIKQQLESSSISPTWDAEKHCIKIKN